MIQGDEDMNEYNAGSPLKDWRKEYKWMRNATHPTQDEIDSGKSDFKTTWRMFCKLDRLGAWHERRAIRAEARAERAEAALADAQRTIEAQAAEIERICANADVENLDDLGAWIVVAQSEITNLAGQLRDICVELQSAYMRGDVSLANVTIGYVSEWDSETPLCQKLDGVGDEVEA
jgi:hypothetical protein